MADESREERGAKVIEVLNKARVSPASPRKSGVGPLYAA